MIYDGTIDNIPPGILTCIIEGREVTVEAISRAHCMVRLFEVNEENKEFEVEFHCFLWEASGYEKFGPFQARVADSKREEFYVSLCLEIASASYGTMIGRMEKQLYSYINSKLEGLPEAESFSRDYEEWKAKRRDSLCDFHRYVVSLCQETGTQLARSLDNPLMINRFIRGDFDEEISAGLGRIYLGNAYCHNLFPTAVQAQQALIRAKAKGLKVTLVHSYLREELMEQQQENAHQIIEICLEMGIRPEVEINDLGWFEFFCNNYKGCLVLSIGRLINKRRKDPRYKNKNRWECIGSIRGDNSLNDPDLLEYYRGLGVSRAEVETAGYKINLPGCSSSLHLPMYQTNTSQYCPLYALVKKGDRGKQGLVKKCDMPCLTNKVLYADDYNMIGCYNSVFALDIWTMKNKEQLRNYISSGADRIVWSELL